MGVFNQICLNGGATYIIGEMKSKDNLNIANLMQTFENLLLQNYSTNFLDITYKFPWVCVIKACSYGGATYIICEIITKNTFNIANLMKTFENLLLQNY